MWHYFHLPVIIFCHKGPKILFGCSKTCESDCEAIKIRFTDGLVTQFLLDWSSNVGQRPGRRPGEGVFSRFLDFFRKKVLDQTILHAYLGPQRILGHTHFRVFQKAH